MLFKPQMLAQIRAGRKNQTRRRSTHRDGTYLHYQAGREYAYQPGRGKAHVGHLVVGAVSFEPLCAMRQADARHEGFAGPGRPPRGVRGPGRPPTRGSRT